MFRLPSPRKHAAADLAWAAVYNLKWFRHVQGQGQHHGLHAVAFGDVAGLLNGDRFELWHCSAPLNLSCHLSRFEVRDGSGGFQSLVLSVPTNTADAIYESSLDVFVSWRRSLGIQRVPVTDCVLRWDQVGKARIVEVKECFCLDAASPRRTVQRQGRSRSARVHADTAPERDNLPDPSDAADLIMQEQIGSDVGADE
eukprot:12311368-Alexandrium_andersonii.AAC.1